MFARGLFARSWLSTLEASWNVRMTSAINTSWSSHPRDTQVLVFQTSSFHDRWTVEIAPALKRDTPKTACCRPESRVASSHISRDCENFVTLCKIRNRAQSATGQSPRLPRSPLLARGVTEGEWTAWTSDVIGQPHPLRRRYFHFRVVAGFSLSRERRDRSRSKFPHSILNLVDEARKEMRNPW